MENNTGFRSFIASFAAVKGQRVMLNSSGGVDLATAVNGVTIGVVTQDCASGDSVTVKLLTAPGTFEVTANGAITAGAVCYGGASGKLSPTSVSSNTASFRAIEAATADGDLIEVIPLLPGN
jgi:hypothetical protein